MKGRYHWIRVGEALISSRESRCVKLEEQLKRRTEQLNVAREDANRMVREELASSERMRIAAETALVQERQQLRTAQDEIATVWLPPLHDADIWSVAAEVNTRINKGSTAAGRSV